MSLTKENKRLEAILAKAKRDLKKHNEQLRKELAELGIDPDDAPRSKHSGKGKSARSADRSSSSSSSTAIRSSDVALGSSNRRRSTSRSSRASSSVRSDDSGSEEENK